MKFAGTLVASIVILVAALLGVVGIESAAAGAAHDALPVSSWAYGRKGRNC
jgi:hypothetical protein